MGGDIWVSSIEGKGSTFSFTVVMAPATRPATHATVALNEPQEWKERAHILVVEDNTVNQVTLVCCYGNINSWLLSKFSRDWDFPIIRELLMEDKQLKWFEKLMKIISHSM
jgi:hypothetical protein